jgi:RNA 2',3'-cyclic 3'-phosphodiesterase
VRLFFALWPPAATVAALAAWTAQVQKATGGRVTRPESIHLTLAFLGEVADDRVGDAVKAARSVRGERHTLPIERAKVWAHNNIAWVGPERTPPGLESLVRSLHESLRTHGFTIESRPFAAHITLIRKARKAPRLPPPPAVHWPVDEFTLVRSRLSPGGSGYEIADRFRLEA